MQHVADFLDVGIWPDPASALPDYTVANLTVTYDLNDTTSAYLRVENLFDESYQTVRNYSSRAGRSISACRRNSDAAGRGARCRPARALRGRRHGSGKGHAAQGMAVSHTSAIRQPYVLHTRFLPVSQHLARIRRRPRPGRVSMNLCTDQLAMLLAAPGQLVSVSHLASEPQSSAMVAEAAAYLPNRGGAEQIFLMNPDLVLAGSYTSLGSVDLLRQLGVPVVQVPPVSSLDQVAEQILLVGQALGREEAAQAMVAQFQADLAALAVTAPPPATAALYYPNGYTTGSGPWQMMFGAYRVPQHLGRCGACGRRHPAAGAVGDGPAAGHRLLRTLSRRLPR